ncbi:Aste57867_25512 [Aphanomyces stellatus]|uniref:Aste57867_25512 protein n=1 Tax=Aphanomyces stellatus TaxID=120398 RepID=A0A485LT93_9STRA|nr:hypothetical protein As57867_025433 [Aphanomyces stellatus]VFU02135.1 Aste57867_25512 [Aphanomyces stellatus]
MSASTCRSSLRLSNLPRTLQVKITKASSAAALKMSKQVGNPLRETAPDHQRGVAVCPVDDPSRSRADFVDDSVIQVGKDQETSIDRPAPHTHQAPQPAL